MNHLPQAPENHISVISNISKILGDIRKSRCAPSINDTCGKFAIGTTGVVDSSGQLWKQSQAAYTIE